MERVHTKEAAEALLRELPSVLGAFVREDVNGHPREIHLLVAAGPNVKLLAQDVRELLEERLGVPVDHRVISIAQLAEDVVDFDLAAGAAPLPEAEPRLRFEGTTSEVRAQRVSVRVRLQYRSELCEGEATELDAGSGRSRAAALATVRATARAVGPDTRLDIGGVSLFKAFDREYVLVSVIASGGSIGRAPLSLAGAHPVDHDAESAAVMATLKSLNRVLAKILG